MYLASFPNLVPYIQMVGGVNPILLEENNAFVRKFVEDAADSNELAMDSGLGPLIIKSRPDHS
jgi:hypothetical protein